ncbi:ABC transporter permease (plasmid) [Aminobacter sp. NyZ550]|jgi:ribose transport system permease protein|uniref:Monosaccharide ABC transporter membrane protein, CUT2 family n=2 Tax=Aminobacter TaxID=31988 RepID=A0AAC8YTZ9_AMIAI|nr:MULTISPECIES: ABC transporter permease [Aminobacter]AMS44463.1 Monosaccharide ABC transporter membrane protein, CUT2 family [Aminobacter aminovorans]MBA8907713.1 ribose transport system permease protein [Aminobacter ciceronei]MBA9021437.1 ribose transport system permease protein [Aminobacter ciceronei]MBB3704261.1 ribose transport system permease protein [Aminobacter aminovorans]QOF74829.1 ABC transporter permease [Aminobacter sp. SR38]
MSSTNQGAAVRAAGLAGRVNLQQYVVYVGFLAIFLFFAIVLKDSGFLTVRNLSNIVLQTAPVTIMAIGLVFVMSAGEIDLSIGSTVAVAALAAAVTMQGYGLVPGVLAGLGCGLLIGLVNGVLVAYVRLPSFLVTLATLGLFAGVSRSMTDLRSIPVTNEAFTGFFGSGSLLGIPSLIWWTAIAVAFGHILYRETRFGAHVLAIGDNARAASVSGISVPKMRLAVLMISGALAGLAGLLYAGRLQAAKYTLGETDLMTVIAAVIVGGTLLNGGKGSIIGALVGSLMMGMLNNGLILMGLSVSDQMIVRGLIILAAVAVSLREKSR